MSTVTDASVELLKSKLRQGGLYVTKRQVGKTTAILEVCAELGPWRCIVIVPNETSRHFMLEMWADKHGKGTPPSIFVCYRAKDFMRGMSDALTDTNSDSWTYVFIDEYWLCRDFDAPFYAAVGTPPFHVEVI